MASSAGNKRNGAPGAYVVVLGPTTADPLLAETVNQLRARHPAIAVHSIPDPLAANISVYSDWRRGWGAIESAEGRPLRLSEALAVLALRLTSYAPDDDRFDDGDNKYRRGEGYAAWLALLSDPAIHVLNRPGSLWPPVDVLSRFHLRAIARSRGVATIREVFGASVPAGASWRLGLPAGPLHRLDANPSADDPARPFSHLFVDVPWRSLTVSRAGAKLLIDEASTNAAADIDRDRLLADAHRVFDALGVDIGHAVFLRERGRFAFSSVSLATPPSCSRAHLRNLAAALVEQMARRAAVGRSPEAEP
jgi:hypothetical protein